MAPTETTTDRNGYLYFPGCTLKGTAVAYEESMHTLFRLLALPLEELADWNCCGATSYMAIDEAAAFVMSARNLTIARQDGGRDLIAPCSACYLVLRKTQDYVQRYPALRQRVEQALGAPVAPLDAVRVRHPLEVLSTDVGAARLKSKVVRPWPGGPVACYYGCQAVRPYAEVDVPHDPHRMDDLLRAVGVSTVEYPLKTKCCGGSLTGTMHPVGQRLNYILLKEAVRRGAQAIVTICPLCQFNLDVYQPEMHDDGERLDLPVFYLTQVLGWMLGGSPRALGLHRAVSGTTRLRQWRLLEETSDV